MNCSVNSWRPQHPTGHCQLWRVCTIQSQPCCRSSAVEISFLSIHLRNTQSQRCRRSRSNTRSSPPSRIRSFSNLFHQDRRHNLREPNRYALNNVRLKVITALAKIPINPTNNGPAITKPKPTVYSSEID